VHIALMPRPELCQQQGHVHAGALTSILDCACAYAAMTVAPPGVDVLTIEFKVKFIRPVARANRFVAVGKVANKAGANLTLCQGEIFGEQGPQKEATAVMQATISQVRADANAR
jgi:uncharacterized protein (TIGR00369 family)